MRIRTLRAKNYRTLEDVQLDFTTTYSAVCGRNDAGKSNVIRALRLIVRDAPQLFEFYDEDVDALRLSLKTDYPKWSKAAEAERNILVEVTLLLDSERDAGMHRFLVKQLSLDSSPPELQLVVRLRHAAREKEETTREVEVGDKTYSGLDADEVFKRLRTSGAIILHNSTSPDSPFRYVGAFRGYVGGLSDEYGELFRASREALNAKLQKLTKKHEREFEAMLGRLSSKYRLGLGVPEFNIGMLPLSITLGQKDYEVPLNAWGSGTRNRTLILLALLRAKQIGDSETSAEKTTPLLVIEEPESFLHPSAQAEFGRVLSELSDELDVQVIVTTHSPYLLSATDPKANHLLERRVHYRSHLETRVVDTASQDGLRPFAEALGLDTAEISPWRDLVLNGRDRLVLVEGDTDRLYFELLRDPKHGRNALTFEGEVLAYDGTGNLQNSVLLRFVKNRHEKVVVTCDLDMFSTVEKAVKPLGFEPGTDFLALGVDEAGKRCIEGLLPERVRKAVYTEHVDVVAAATGGTKEEQKSAKSRLKRLMFEEFNRVAVPGDEDFGRLYKVAAKINRALANESPRSDRRPG